MTNTSQRLFWFLVLAATAMPAVVRAEDARPAAAATTSTYTVVRGDTLSEIAQRQGVSLAALEAANPQIRDFDRIFPGDRVAIPARDPARDAVSAAAPRQQASAPLARPQSAAPASQQASTPRTPLQRIQQFVQRLPGIAGQVVNAVSEVGVRAIEAILGGSLRNPNMPHDPTNWGRWCRALVREAFKRATGRNLPELQAGSTAWDSFLAFQREGLVQTGTTPPRGAIVFWSPQERGRMAPGSAGATAGHIAISNGDGTVISNARGGINPGIRMSAFGNIAGYVVIASR